MTITDNILNRIRAVARKLAKHEQDYEDCVQIGRIKVWTMDVGGTESFYVHGAKFSIRDYLKKERLHREREQSNTVDLWGDTDADTT